MRGTSRAERADLRVIALATSYSLPFSFFGNFKRPPVKQEESVSYPAPETCGKILAHSSVVTELFHFIV